MATKPIRRTEPLVQRWMILAAGDFLAFVVFSALGHNNHNESEGLGSVIGTALPFAAGWFAVAPWVGAFPRVRALPVRRLLQRTAYAWVCAWPVALLLRALVLQRGIPVSFAIVSLIANMVLLVGWRGLYARFAGKNEGR